MYKNKILIQLMHRVVFFCVLFILLFPYAYLHAGHAISRYFPLIEKPERSLFRQKNYVSPALFLTRAASAFRRDGTSGGVPELWGTHDLKDIISGLQEVRQGEGELYENPFLNMLGVEELAGKSIIHEMEGEITSFGVLLESSHAVLSPYLYIGFSLPVMYVQSNTQFLLNRGSDDPQDTTDPVVKLLDQGQVNQVERVLLSVHRELGLDTQDWNKAGLGDLDLYVRLHKYYDHRFLMKGVNANLVAGITAPTGVRRDQNNPSSVPFMGNGHWGLFLDGVLELELKQDWKIGLIGNIMHQLSRTSKQRIPVFKEPAPFSALQGDIKTHPGITLKGSGYLTVENLADGLHVQGRYTYLRHERDTWRDMRDDKVVNSFLEQEASSTRTTEEIVSNKEAQRNLSSWRAHYFTVRLCYDSVAAMKKWPLQPTFFIQYDSPVGGRGISKTHQVTFGLELFF